MSQLRYLEVFFYQLFWKGIWARAHSGGQRRLARTCWPSWIFFFFFGKGHPLSPWGNLRYSSGDNSQLKMFQATYCLVLLKINVDNFQTKSFKHFCNFFCVFKQCPRYSNEHQNRDWEMLRAVLRNGDKFPSELMHFNVWDNVWSSLLLSTIWENVGKCLEAGDISKGTVTYNPTLTLISFMYLKSLSKLEIWEYLGNHSNLNVVQKYIV